MSVLNAVSVESLTIGQGLICSLLTGLILLLKYIWNQHQKSQEERHKELKEASERRHQDQLALMKRMDERQKEIEDRQKKVEDKQIQQHYELVAFNRIINLLQNKPQDYKFPKDDS